VKATVEAAILLSCSASEAAASCSGAEAEGLTVISDGSAAPARTSPAVSAGLTLASTQQRANSLRGAIVVVVTDPLTKFERARSAAHDARGPIRAAAIVVDPIETFHINFAVSGAFWKYLVHDRVFRVHIEHLRLC
jgi:hypothetical protein